MVKHLLILFLCGNGALAAMPPENTQTITGATPEGWFMRINDENQPTVFVQKASAKKKKNGHNIVGRGVYCYDTIYNTVCRWYPGIDYDAEAAAAKELDRICSTPRLSADCPDPVTPDFPDPWELR